MRDGGVGNSDFNVGEAKNKLIVWYNLKRGRTAEKKRISCKCVPDNNISLLGVTCQLWKRRERT